MLKISKARRAAAPILTTSNPPYTLTTPEVLSSTNVKFRRKKERKEINRYL
jgi:hypothetical protein